MTPRIRPHRSHVVAAAVLAAALALCLHLLGGAAPVLAAAPVPATPPARHGATAVLVELFTSEGCSSCPPADTLLARLDRDQPVPGADIIVLGEHVDYWDTLGWKDRFSSSTFTKRQTDYQSRFQTADIYTPQAIVNGSTQLNGSDSQAIQAAIKQAAAANPVPLTITGVRIKGDTVLFTLQQDLPATPGAVNLFAALVDPADTTTVRDGENRGRTLHHAGVVRTLALLGSSWRNRDLGSPPLAVQARDLANLGGMRLVVFAQARAAGPIVGLTACSLVPSASATASGTSHASFIPCPTLTL